MRYYISADELSSRQGMIIAVGLLLVVGWIFVRTLRPIG